jgi:hypothetical protein
LSSGGQPRELRVDALSAAEWNYLRGLFLTDGYSDRSAKRGRFRVRFLLQGNEGELLSRVCELLRRAGLNPYTYGDSRKSMLTVEVNSMQLFEFLPDKRALGESAEARSRFFGENGLYSVERGVPFLAGLLDGDGYCGVRVGKRYFFRTVTVCTWVFSQDNSLFLVDYVRRFVESLAPNGVRMKRRRDRRTLAACFRKSGIAALLDAGIARHSWKVARWLQQTAEARSERKGFFTAGRAADAIGVPYPVFAWWLNTGKVHYVRRGKWYYIPASEVERLKREFAKKPR